MSKQYYYQNKIPSYPEAHITNAAALAKQYPKETALLLQHHRDSFSECGIFSSGYSTVKASVLMDFRLSSWAKLAYCVLKLGCDASQTTHFKEWTLRRGTGLGLYKLRGAMQELRKYGYIDATAQRDDKGRFCAKSLHCTDNPRKMQGSYTYEKFVRGALVSFSLNYKQCARLPRLVFFDETLTKYDRLVYAACCVMAGEAMGFDGKHGQLAVLLGLRLPSITKALANLQAHGYIATKRIYQGTRYVLNYKPHYAVYPDTFFCHDMCVLMARASKTNIFDPWRFSPDTLPHKPVKFVIRPELACASEEAIATPYASRNLAKISRTEASLRKRIKDYKQLLFADDPRLQLHRAARR